MECLKFVIGFPLVNETYQCSCNEQNAAKLPLAVGFILCPNTKCDKPTVVTPQKRNKLYTVCFNLLPLTTRLLKVFLTLSSLL